MIAVVADGQVYKVAAPPWLTETNDAFLNVFVCYFYPKAIASASRPSSAGSNDNFA